MNNNPIELVSLLKEKSDRSWSGCIEIIEPKDSSVCWQVYFLQGQIQYATSKNGKQERLNYLFQKFKLEDCPQLSEESSEYQQLVKWLSIKKLEDAEIAKYLFQFSQEAMNHIVAIEKAPISLMSNEHLKCQTTNFSLNKFGRDKTKISAKQLREYIDSPFRRFNLDKKNSLNFYKFWKKIYDLPEFGHVSESLKLASFVSFFVTKNCFYEIATKTNLDCLILGKHIQECLNSNLLTLLPYTEAEEEKNASFSDRTRKSASEKTPSFSELNLQKNKIATKNKQRSLIVCVDDSKTVQKQIKMTLEAADYEVVSITDPSKAFKELSVLKPILILMDINMPNINGYDLCSMLRKSQKFKVIPIVMLTGRDGMIDRMRAKLVGSTDYLIKPCDPNRLIELVNKLDKKNKIASSI